MATTLGGRERAKISSRVALKLTFNNLLFKNGKKKKVRKMRDTQVLVIYKNKIKNAIQSIHEL
jgi:hypothetical protein